MNAHKTMTDVHPVDQRLTALYNEYLENDNEEEFVWMLYLILDTVTPEIKKHVMSNHRSYKRKQTKGEEAVINQKLKDFIDGMTIEERINFQNTTWDEQPDWIKENHKKLVKHPEAFNDMRISGSVKKTARQNEVFASRVLRCMEQRGFVTSDEEGTKLDYKRFSDLCNDLAKDYDLPAVHGKRAQRTRVTPADIKSYIEDCVTPKRDKMTVIAEALDVPMGYLGGYGSNTPPKTNDLISGKFRKQRA